VKSLDTSSGTVEVRENKEKRQKEEIGLRYWEVE